MRICFILEYYYPHRGGVETLFKNLAERLSERGHTVTVVTRMLKDTAREELIRGVRVVRVPTFNRYLFTFLSIPKAFSASRECDVIHTTTYNAAFPAWLVGLLRRRPVIITVHEVWINQWRALTDMGRFSALLHNLLEKMIYMIKFNKYIAVSHSTEKQLLKVGIRPERVAAIYNGFAGEAFEKDYSDHRVREQYGLQKSFLCFSWGRPGVSKGHEYLIRAVPFIKRRIPEMKLLLMLSDRDSYGKRYRQLILLIQELGLDKDIILAEPAGNKELVRFLKESDCAVIPSVAEGFGYAVLEACSAGVPVVASDSTSIPEVIGGKYVLVEPRNPEAIAAGVDLIYRGSFVRSPLKHFPWEQTVAEYEAEYTNTINKSH